MTIHLTPEIEKIIRRDIQRGCYRSADEYVERAVRLLHDQEELLACEKDLIASKIASGIAQLDGGEGIPGDASRARLQERKAALLSKKTPR